MRWVLKDSATGEWFAIPHGPDNSEWSSDLSKARHLYTEEQALAAAQLWRDLNKGNLLVMHYDHAKEFERLRGHD